MAREHWYFICGVLVVVPLALLLAVKKLPLREPGPDRVIAYKTIGQRQLALHAFAAQKTNGEPVPALLLFHGGRWLYGGPRSLYPQCRYFATQGISCFSAQYRLGSNNIPDVRGATRDARDAFNYLIEHARELNIDPGKISAGGGSSGGHLAAAIGVGLPLGGENPRRPAALILYNPMLDLSPCTPDHHLVSGYWENVSPLHHIDGDVPPTLVLAGTADPEVPVATVEAFCAAVSTAGGHCETALYPGQSHGFFNDRRGERNYFDETNRRVLEFLARSASDKRIQEG